MRLVLLQIALPQFDRKFAKLPGITQKRHRNTICPRASFADPESIAGDWLVLTSQSLVAIL